MKNPQAQTERVMDLLPLGILILDRANAVLSYNDMALELLGIEALDILSKGLDELVPSDEFKACLAEVWKRETEKRQICFLSGERFVCCTLRMTDDVDPGSKNVLVSVEDISRLQDLERIGKEFLQTILHRIRDPLTTLKMTLSMLSKDVQGQIPDYAKEILIMTSQEVNRMSALADDLRSLYFIETGLAPKELTIEEFPAAKVVDRAIEQLPRTAGAPERIRERIHVQGDASLCLKADFEKTRQILIKLVCNAIVFSAENADIIVHVSRNSGFVTLEIKDTGCGISEEKLPQVFTKFYREDNPVTRGVNGNGLGLFIAKSFAEMMKGTLFCESRKGQGSVFSLRMPAA